MKNTYVVAIVGCAVACGIWGGMFNNMFESKASATPASISTTHDIVGSTAINFDAILGAHINYSILPVIQVGTQSLRPVSITLVYQNLEETLLIKKIHKLIRSNSKETLDFSVSNFDIYATQDWTSPIVNRSFKVYITPSTNQTWGSLTSFDQVEIIN